MKKIISTLLFICVTIAITAQTRTVTKFLGIPVDGTKTAMIQKLKAKGFNYDNINDCLVGEFNGMLSNIYVVTNRNKVWRIMVSDRNTTSETNIKIRFNNLCNQFANNKKYSFPNFEVVDYTIPEDEKIQYELTLHNKRYEAAFWQGNLQDSISVKNEIYHDMEKLWYKNYEGLTKEQIDSIPVETQKEQFTEAVIKYLQLAAEKFSKRPVWFMISKDDYEVYRPYRILMFYDNEYNHSNGEDL